MKRDAVFVGNIVERAQSNSFFRQEVVTNRYSQVVVMALHAGEEIGQESHAVDQIIIIVEGQGKAVLAQSDEFVLKSGDMVVVPAGTVHNIINTSVDAPLKLYTIYAPPQHKPHTINREKPDND
jgi:mannose-6-phosphate isomerase-like protein (cupin superfamily)